MEGLTAKYEEKGSIVLRGPLTCLVKATGARAIMPIIWGWGRVGS